MSGTYKRWLEGDKVTEKHLAGPFDGLPDTVVSGLLITDTSGGGSAKIDVSAGVAHIAGYEQRPVAKTATVISNDSIAYVFLSWDETIVISITAIASETYPPTPPAGHPRYILVGIVETGTGTVSWIWHNARVRKAHVDELAFRAGRGIPDRATLVGTPRIEFGSASVGATAWGSVLSWPAAGTIRGRIDFIAFERTGAGDRIAILCDDEVGITPSGGSFYWRYDVFNEYITQFPHIDDDFFMSTVCNHQGMIAFSNDVPGVKEVENFWIRGQFEEEFDIQMYNGTGAPKTMKCIVGIEEFVDNNLGGY